MTHLKSVLTLALVGLLLVGCNNSTSENYTIHYEMRGTNPMDPNSTEEMTLLRRKLYVNKDFGVILTYPGDEESPFNMGLAQIEEFGYLDFKTQTMTNVHKWPTETLTTVEQFSDNKPKTLTEETRTILGYNCKKAIYDMNGREIEVWYTTDFPLKHGTIYFGADLGFVLHMAQFEAVKIDNSIPKEIQMKLPENLGKIVTHDELMKKMMGG